MCTARAIHARCITPCTLHHAMHALSALRHAMHVPSAQLHGRGALCGQVERQGPAGDADRRSVGLAGHAHAAHAHGALGAALLAAEPGLLRPVLHLGLVVTTPLCTTGTLKCSPQGPCRSVLFAAGPEEHIFRSSSVAGWRLSPPRPFEMVFVCSMINVSTGHIRLIVASCVKPYAVCTCIRSAHNLHKIYLVWSVWSVGSVTWGLGKYKTRRATDQKAKGITPWPHRPTNDVCPVNVRRDAAQFV